MPRTYEVQIIIPSSDEQSQTYKINSKGPASAIRKALRLTGKIKLDTHETMSLFVRHSND